MILRLAPRLKSLCLQAMRRHAPAVVLVTVPCTFATVPAPHEKIDKLHAVIEEYRKRTFPQTLPREFVVDVMEAADENKDGVISIDEMTAMLRNLSTHRPMERDEVQFLMERDLNMDPEAGFVPLELAKKLLLDIYH